MAETESNLHTETVRLDADGTELECYLAFDDHGAARRPGVLVVHEWWGLTDHVRGRAHMLAELGYPALAVDMYGGGQVADNPDDAGRLMNGVLGDMSQADSRLGAALGYLSESRRRGLGTHSRHWLLLRWRDGAARGTHRSAVSRCGQFSRGVGFFSQARSR